MFRTETPRNVWPFTPTMQSEMTQTIRLAFGTTSLEIHVDLPDDCLSDAWVDPGASVDLAESVCGAIRHPVDFPPIDQAVVPGDKVVIAVDADVPSPEAAIAGTVRAIGGREVESVSVVVPESMPRATIDRIRRSLPDAIALHVHDDRQRESLRYLAADDRADPIYLNRHLVDADLVIPISVARTSDPLGVNPFPSVLYPALADRQSRHRSLAQLRRSILKPGGSKPKAADAADPPHGGGQRIDWLLGVPIVVAVEMGECGRPAGVLAGTAEGVWTRVRDHQARSQANLAERCSELVVACIEGDSQQQTLPNLLRALLVSRSFASDQASVVVLCEIDNLDPAQGERGVDSDDEIDADSSPETASEAELLRELVTRIDPSRRYLLLSRCEPHQVESLGMGVIADERELARLVNGHASCTVIRVAQTAAMATGHEHALLGPEHLRE